MSSGFIFDIKRFAIHDGPGVRTTVFFKGCSLRCWACHNPEGQERAPDLMLREERCNLCGDCVELCAQHAVSLEGETLLIDRVKCDLCGRCAEECLTGAIELAGREATAAEVMQQIERDTVYYDEGGGGVTFSGGEPLFQPGFLLTLLRACKRREIATTLDTCGYAPRRVIEAVYPLVDLFLYDLKLIDNDRHREFTDVPNGPILGNLRWLAGVAAPVIVRFPLLPEVNDDEANVRALGEFLAELATLYPVDVLPYHRIGVDKYERLSRPYRLEQAETPPDATVATTVRVLEEFGLQVTVRGEAYVSER
jgi:pyruvate formate lyase activating enzyme